MASEHGKFCVAADQDLQALLDVLGEDIDLFTDDFLMPEIQHVNDGNCASNPEENMRKMEAALQPPKEELQPLFTCAETGTTKEKMTGRFKPLTESDLGDIEGCRQSKSTKKNTKWGVKIIQDWNFEMTGEYINFEEISAVELNEKLRHFYAEAQPQHIDKRAQFMERSQAAEYHKNSFKNIRSAINRHIHDIGRDIDIVRDKDFRTANNVLDGKLKLNTCTGKSRPTKHKAIIEKQDLEKICSYIHSDINNPVILRYKVWFDLSVHFLSRGLEFHQQLKLNSFTFSSDENNVEYAVLNHETKQKTVQGGLESEESNGEKRMYSSDGPNCPIKSLKLLISKTPPDSVSLFNHCDKRALESSEFQTYWYINRPVKQHQFCRFMSDITRNSQCSKSYTAHCIRATCIQSMNDAGFELRHIMLMSGHRNESSIRSYNRDCSSKQKKQISETLSTTVSHTATDADASDFHLDTSVIQHTATRCNEIVKYTTPIQNTQNNSSNFMSSGIISNSAFHNCVFNFSNQQ